MTQQFDVLIIGSGLAGLTMALQVADTKKVCLVSKREVSDSASSWAQGGIAAVLNSDDSIEEHIQDTLIAGAGLCDTAITRLVATEAREAVEWLITQGVEFTREADNSGYHLTREGGHSQRRIVHVADATGHAVQKTLAQKVREHANITILEHHIAVDFVATRFQLREIRLPEKIERPREKRMQRNVTISLVNVVENHLRTVLSISLVFKNFTAIATSVGLSVRATGSSVSSSTISM